MHFFYGNSVLPILIEKNFEQKNYFCLLKMWSVFFFKEGKSFLSIELERLPKSLSSCKKIQDFSFHTFLKKTSSPRHIPTQGCQLSPTCGKTHTQFSKDLFDFPFL